MHLVSGLNIFTNGRCDTSAGFLQKYSAKRNVEQGLIESTTENPGT